MLEISPDFKHFMGRSAKMTTTIMTTMTVTTAVTMRSSASPKNNFARAVYIVPDSQRRFSAASYIMTELKKSLLVGGDKF